MTINLISDTVTKPTPAMLEAMMSAPVGDEQHMADPSVNALCERSAKLLGKEAAVFLPSGTMANEISLLVHCERGDEVFAQDTSHIINFEGGAASALSGAQVRALPGELGMYDGETLRAAMDRTGGDADLLRDVGHAALETLTPVDGDKAETLFKAVGSAPTAANSGTMKPVIRRSETIRSVTMRTSSWVRGPALSRMASGMPTLPMS